jgi:hypothetical protein
MHQVVDEPLALVFGHLDPVEAAFVGTDGS